MQLHKRLIMLLALGVSVTASASTDTDLWRAADKGDSSAVEAALKAGANVNARFDIGRTALIIAAMKGRVSAIEKLLDAGADMYMRDSNGHDALTIAAEYEQPTVVRTLLNRGFDPSLNDWRALRLLPEERKNNKFAESIGPKQREIRQMLLERRAKGGTTPLQTAAATASTNSNPPNGVSSDASPVVIDISGQKVTPEIFKTAATRALLRRGWQITGNEDNRLVGTLTKDMTYKAAVAFSAPLIIISYEKGSGSPRQNWLLNIKKDLLFELNVLLASQ